MKHGQKIWFILAVLLEARADSIPTPKSRSGKTNVVGVNILDSRVLLELCGAVASRKKEIKIEWRKRVTARAEPIDVLSGRDV